METLPRELVIVHQGLPNLLAKIRYTIKYTAIDEKSQRKNDVNIFDLTKNAVNIVSVIQDLGYELVRSGSEYRGPHTHNNPSCMAVKETEQFYYCHHCKESGSVIDFWMSHHNCDAYTACLDIAKQYGVNISLDKDWTPEQREAYDNRNKKALRVQAVIDDSIAWWHSQVDRDYFRSRGITDETIDAKKLGFSPADWSAHLKHLKSAGHNEVDIRESGLFYLNDKKQTVPSMFDRHIIPHFYQNRATYITGRAASEDSEQFGKYKHSRLDGVNTDVVFKPIYGEDRLQRLCKEKFDPNQYTPSPVVLIVEGTLDALLAEQEWGDRYAVISPHTTKFSKEQQVRISPVLDKLKPRSIIVCMDSDKAGMQGAFDTARWLEPSHSNENVHITQMPPDMDIADYVAVNKSDEALYWIRSSPALWRYTRTIAERDNRFVNDPKSATPHPKFVADELEIDGRYFKSIGFTQNSTGDIYEYRGGVYKKNTDEIRRNINSKMGQLTTPRSVSSVLQQMNNRHICQLSDFEHPHLINCQNCIIDVSDMNNPKIVPHSPYIYSLTQYPWQHDKHAECPDFDKFVSEVVGADDQDIIFEMIGHCLVQDSPFENMFVLYDNGIGGTGKSTMLKVIQAVVGEDNYSAQTLQDICDPLKPYATASLIGKAANIYADLPADTLQDISNIRTITSRDTITVRQIYQSAVQITPYATMIFSTNVMPSMKGFRQPDKDRLILIDFPNRFRFSGHEVPKDQLLAQLTNEKELAGIAHKSLVKYKQAVVNNKLSVSGHSIELGNLYAQETDKVLAFVDKCIRVGNGNDYLTAKQLREKFLDIYPKETISEAELARRITEHINSNSEVFDIAVKRKRVNGKSTYFVNHIYFAEGKDNGSYEDVDTDGVPL